MTARLFIVPIPQEEAVALNVPKGSSLVTRMDIHPRPNCVLAPGCPLGLASVCERLQLEHGNEVVVRQYVAADNGYYSYTTKIEVDSRG